MFYLNNCFAFVFSVLIAAYAITAVIAQFNCTGENVCDARFDRSCRPRNGCERFCEPPASCMIPFLPCYCRRGYARNATGHCIQRRNCPRAVVCGDYECPNRNSSCRCEAYCWSRSAVCIILPSGCHCARGFARNNQNVCVPLTMCPRPVITTETTTTTGA